MDVSKRLPLSALRGCTRLYGNSNNNTNMISHDDSIVLSKCCHTGSGIPLVIIFYFEINTNRTNELTCFVVLNSRGLLCFARRCLRVRAGRNYYHASPGDVFCFYCDTHRSPNASPHVSARSVCASKIQPVQSVRGSEHKGCGQPDMITIAFEFQRRYGDFLHRMRDGATVRTTYNRRRPVCRSVLRCILYDYHNRGPQSVMQSALWSEFWCFARIASRRCA